MSSITVTEYRNFNKSILKQLILPPGTPDTVGPSGIVQQIGPPGTVQQIRPPGTPDRPPGTLQIGPPGTPDRPPGWTDRANWYTR